MDICACVLLVACTRYAAKLLDSLLTRYANHEVSDVLQYYSLKAQLKLKGYDKAKVRPRHAVSKYVMAVMVGTLFMHSNPCVAGI